MDCSVEDGMISCDKCPRQYANQSALNRHRKSHDRDKWYTCRVCRLRFSRIDILKRHERVHSDNGRGCRDRKRSIRACDNCRKSKVRCDAKEPCRPCQKVQKECTYQTGSLRASLQDFRNETAFSPKSPPPEEIIQLSTTYADDAQPLMTPSTDGSDHNLPAEFETTDHVETTDLPQSTAVSIPPESYSQVLCQFDQSLLEQLTTPLLDFSFELPPFNPLGTEFFTAHPNEASFCGFPGIGTTSPLEPQPLGSSSTSWMLPDPIEFDSCLPINGLAGTSRTTTQNDATSLVENIAQEASREFLDSVFTDPVLQCGRRLAKSRDIESAFMLDKFTAEKSAHLLHTFVASFFDSFHAMWPMTWRQGFDYDTVDPLLYLTMTSIGAMYVDNSEARSYGVAMHLALRPILLNACLVCPEDEGKLESIFEALLLTEIMSLYLGHAQAATFAHQASAVLTAHARRIGLLSEPPSHSSTSTLSPELLSEAELEEWIRTERRRRMAFGFLRCEIFSGMLLNTKPLLSSGEFELRLPCRHDLWIYVGPNWREKLLIAAQEEASHSIFYSDLLHMATRKSFRGTPWLSAAAHELLLYGLQAMLLESIQDNRRSKHSNVSNWMRLGARRNRRHIEQQSDHTDVDDADTITVLDNQEPGPSGRSLGHMSRWKDWYCFLSQPTPQSRFLYHLGHINMNTDLESLHQLSSCKTHEMTPTQSSRAQETILWATTESARVALHHARQIWSLMEAKIIEQESTRDSKGLSLRPESCLNILSIASLYHAAVVTWAMAALSDRGLSLWEDTAGASSGPSNGDIRQDLEKVANIASKLSPSWETTSSVLVAIKELPQKPFPVVVSGKG